MRKARGSTRRQKLGRAPERRDTHPKNALRASEERFRMLADNMSQLAWTCDLLGNVTWYNKRWLDYTGLAFEDMKGWDWTKVQHPDHVDRVVARVQRSAETGEPWEDTFPLRGKDGTYRWFLSRALPIHDEQGHLMQWFGTNTDVTEQKLAEEQVTRQAQELRLLNERLQTLDRLKNEFFSNVSHEFRTPLTLLLGPVEDMLAMKDGTLSHDALQQVEVIQRNARRLQRLVNTLLDFSRIEEGRVQASYVETDVATLTADLASVFRAAMEKAGLTFVVDCPALKQSVFVDRDMWEKIVFNLLSNAFKFTLKGAVEVKLRAIVAPAESEHGGESCVELSVQDTGVGIPANELPNVFQRFHRIDTRRGRTHEGTGIGLSLVQELVKLHGGTIEVDSEPEHGTVFRVRVPFGHTHLPADRIGADSTQASTALRADVFLQEALTWLPEATDAAAPEQTATPALDSDRPRVLLADDNSDMRAYVRRLLQTRYTVEAVSNGSAALAAARKHPPHLIISDVMMPELDGFELVEHLRADPKLRNIPIILVSARAGEQALVEGISTGVDDYLIKPFSARELLARVATHLEMARIRQVTEECVHQGESALRESEERLRRTNLELVQRVDEIQQANLEIENGRRAALNLMEDTVKSRRGVEALNVELRESEEALRRLNNELEQRVSERTQDLAQSEDRLRMLATELNLAEQRERKRLATELHDYLAQLLVLCHMSLAQAKRVGLPPRAEELVKATEETLGKALNYCRTLMAELSPPVLQQEGLPAGLKWLADHMKRQDLAVAIEIDDVGKLLVPDDRAVLLFQSVRELLINVAKHGTVKTATVRMSHENGLLQLVVRDENGFDLAAVSARETTSPLSSRFGLFSIRERMKALGGSFDIQSAPGQGTTATLTLQVATNTDGSALRTDRTEKAVPHRQSTLSLSPDDPPRSIQASGSKKDATIRLLLVDDQTLMRQGLRSIVSAYNHLEVVGEARDGMEAVEIVQRLNPDVVVMDINMPNLDGIEATKRIKAYRSDIAVIGLSVNPSIETEQKMKAAGAASYLTKESAAEVLCEAIDKAMAPKEGIATQQDR